MGPNLQKNRKKQSNKPFFDGEKSSDMSRGFRPLAAHPTTKKKKKKKKSSTPTREEALIRLW